MPVQQQERSAADLEEAHQKSEEGGPGSSFRCQEPSCTKVRLRFVNLRNSLLPCEQNIENSAKGTKSAVMTWWMALTCSKIGSMSLEGSAPRSLTWDVNVPRTLVCGRRASSESKLTVQRQVQESSIGCDGPSGDGARGPPHPSLPTWNVSSCDYLVLRSEAQA